MKKSTLLPLAIAAALALAGCASTESETGAPVETTSAAPTAAAKPTGTQLDAQALADIAQEIAGDDPKAVVVDEAALVAQLPLAEKQLKAMKIEPAKCAAFVSADLSAELDKTNVISVALPGATAIEGVQVAVASYKDPADATANISQSEAMLKDCSAFSMTLQGQQVDMKVSELEAKTKAEVTAANQSLVKVPGGEISTVAVSALQGNNLVSVSILGGSDAADDVKQAQDMVNTVLELISAQAS
jgi:PBP1b-binding outer membrane lipoprotein LpoB